MDTLTEPQRRVRRPVATLWSLRMLLSVHLLAVLCQPILAGLFLTGDVDAIAVHSAVAVGIEFLALIALLVAIGYVTVGRGRLWTLPAVFGLFMLEGLQAGFGYARVLQFHVPLGVAVVVVSVLLAAWVWTRSAALPRGAR